MPIYCVYTLIQNQRFLNKSGTYLVILKPVIFGYDCGTFEVNLIFLIQIGRCWFCYADFVWIIRIAALSCGCRIGLWNLFSHYLLTNRDILKRYSSNINELSKQTFWSYRIIVPESHRNRHTTNSCMSKLVAFVWYRYIEKVYTVYVWNCDEIAWIFLIFDVALPGTFISSK